MNSKEEKAIMTSVENGEWAPVRDINEFKKKLAGAAAQTGLKNFRINIRIAGRDVAALKTRALEEGIPYQTLAAMILHKYVTGRIIEKTKP